MNRRILALLALAALALLGLAAPAIGDRGRATDAVTGSFVPTATGFQATIKNETSSTFYYNQGRFSDGRAVTGASWNGNPCQLLGDGAFDCGPYTLAPGESATIDIAAGTDNNAGLVLKLAFSSDKQTYANGPYDIPEAPSTPPTTAVTETVPTTTTTPPPAKCQCVRIKVTAKGFSSVEPTNPKGPTSMGATLHWFMACSKGVGGCEGEIAISPPAGSDIKVLAPKKATVTCHGQCKKISAWSDGGVRMKTNSADDLSFDSRAEKKIRFTLHFFCLHDGKKVAVGKETLTFAFGRQGYLDPKASDLNGNGVPDGKEKPKGK
jgi:hypothetical protein